MSPQKGILTIKANACHRPPHSLTTTFPSRTPYHLSGRPLGALSRRLDMMQTILRLSTLMTLSPRGFHPVQPLGRHHSTRLCHPSNLKVKVKIRTVRYRLNLLTFGTCSEAMGATLLTSLCHCDRDQTVNLHSFPLRPSHLQSSIIHSHSTAFIHIFSGSNSISCLASCAPSSWSLTYLHTSTSESSCTYSSTLSLSVFRGLRITYYHFLGT